MSKTTQREKSLGDQKISIMLLLQLLFCIQIFEVLGRIGTTTAFQCHGSELSQGCLELLIVRFLEKLLGIPEQIQQ